MPSVQGSAPSWGAMERFSAASSMMTVLGGIHLRVNRDISTRNKKWDNHSGCE